MGINTGNVCLNFEPDISRIYTTQLQSWVPLLRSTPMKMELLVSSETSALKAQTPGDYPEDTIRQADSRPATIEVPFRVCTPDVTPWSQEFATRICSEPFETSPHHHGVFLQDSFQ